MGRVLAVGWACVDLRFHLEAWPPRASRTEVKAYREALGGPAAVAARTVARLGGEAHLLSRRGQDRLGDWLEEALRGTGVTPHLIPGEATPVSAVLVAPGGERYIFPYRGRLPEGLESGWFSLLDAVDVVLADLRWPEAGRMVFLEARRRGLPRVLDLDQVGEEALGLARLASHVVASQEAEEALGGVEALERLFPEAFVAATRGEEGVVWPGGRWQALPVRPRDTTGAGDVFHGAFAWALARSFDAIKALQIANIVAGLYVERGEVPEWEEVRGWMALSEKDSL